MKSAVAYLVAALVVGGVGLSLWANGHLQRRAVVAREGLLTLQFATSPGERQVFETALEYTRRLPWMGQIGAGVAEQRATSRYWLEQFQTLAPDADPAAAAADLDPSLLMFSAHAAYRRLALDTDSDAVKELERILDLYAEVLKRDPRQIDAAFNYEFVVRRRNALALVRRGSAASRSQAREAAAAPPGRTLHGDRGGIPPGLEDTDFKVIVPQPSDERQEQREAGSGTPRVRKG